MHNADGLAQPLDVTESRNGVSTVPQPTHKPKVAASSQMAANISKASRSVPLRLSTKADDRVAFYAELRGISRQQAASELVLAAEVQDPISASYSAVEDAIVAARDAALLHLWNNFVAAQGKARKSGTLGPLADLMVAFIRGTK